MVQWKDLPIEEATWEDEKILQHPNLAFHPPTSSLGWGGCIKYFNKGGMGPKRNLVYHLHIKLGHTNNKYG